MQFTTLISAAIVGFAALATPARAQHMNKAGLALLTEFEGYRANYYTDTSGHKTICYGYNCDAHDCSGLRPPLSQAQCTTLLAKTLGSYEKCACGMKGMASANSNQFSAMVDFAYNAGCGGLTSTWSGSVAKGNWKGIAEVLPRTYTNGGLAGLVRRRKAEAALILKPTTVKSGC